jgi:D-sedoheptulose 7-phosphate isomerase
LSAGHVLLLCGNGGSAADAQHIAAEFTVRFLNDRTALRAMALATDCSSLTATGNDLGFERVFARQLEAHGRPGDVLIAISTSGNSPNILAALDVARTSQVRTIAMTGAGGGKAASRADHLLAVPSTSTARIQEMHILIGHALCGAVERRLGFLT